MLGHAHGDLKQACPFQIGSNRISLMAPFLPWPRTGVALSRVNSQIARTKYSKYILSQIYSHIFPNEKSTPITSLSLAE